MGNARKLTIVILVVSIILLIIYDIIIAFWVGNETATISYIIRIYSKEFLMIPVVFGVLIGHFFWPLKIDSGK